MSKQRYCSECKYKCKVSLQGIKFVETWYDCTLKVLREKWVKTAHYGHWEKVYRIVIPGQTACKDITRK